MQPLLLDADALDALYDAYRTYSQAMVAPEFLTSFRTEPGTILSVHNHRVLHGRTAFNPTSGPRHLQLSYLDFDDILSKARLIRKAHENRSG